jgi:hypothetical protein
MKLLTKFRIIHAIMAFSLVFMITIGTFLALGFSNWLWILICLPHLLATNELENVMREIKSYD